MIDRSVSGSNSNHVSIVYGSPRELEGAEVLSHTGLSLVRMMVGGLRLTFSRVSLVGSEVRHA